ncbi:MAG: 4Fe-4S binding protein [Bacteroidales bacterium]|nr:4Fe-4S binding protein [Bacteroidales bacterium]
MEKQHFHHALKVHADVCIGCSHCMRVCPTEAIRVWNGTADINSNRCVDCGDCYRVCPVSAIYVEHDDLASIFKYKARVALVPSVLIGQFPEKVKTSQIYNVLYELGFTHVVEVEQGVDIVAEAYNEYTAKPESGPLISTFCPAIVRLIQVRFPSLLENLVLINPPSDITAVYYKKKLQEEGFKESEIGIFYVTPCAAKIAAVKSPEGEDESKIDGVINMNFIYDRIYRTISNQKVDEAISSDMGKLSSKSILWSLTNGEAPYMNGRSLAVDGITNVIEFLEMVENDEEETIDFLELRACDESCAGGILVSGNRFLTIERLRKRAERIEKADSSLAEERLADMAKHKDDILGVNHLKEIKARSIILDQDLGVALDKMKKSRKLLSFLPGFDCGACGAPTCKALAEDIAQKNATLSHCVFMQRVMEKHHRLSPEHAIRIIERIWGRNRLNKDPK